MMDRYLIISTTGMGDCLWGTPAIRALKKSFPEATIDLVVNPAWKPLFEFNPHLNQIFEYRNQWYRQPLLGLQLFGRHYDAIYIFHANKNFKRMLPWFRSLPIWCHQSFDWIPESQCVKIDSQVHGIQKRLIMLEKHGVRPDGGKMEIFFQPPEQQVVEKFLNDHNLSPQKYIYLNIGASGPDRRWPKERFMELAEKLLESTEHSIILGGGPGEKESINEILSALGPKRCVNSLELTLKQDAYTISLARLLVSCDTGPMHIGFATRVPTISIFGPYDPKGTGPYDLEENKCFRVLPSENKTLQDITVEEVWGTVQVALKK